MEERSNLKRKRKLSVRVPGSSGNLGPGFDTLALAFKIYSRLSLEVCPELEDGPVIKLAGAHIDGLKDDRSNLVVRVIEKYFQKTGADLSLLKSLKLEIKNDIPLARGLGSSSAAGIAAVWGAQWLVGQEFDLDQCIQAISNREGHAENSASSATGGLVTVSKNKTGSYDYMTLPWPDSWSTIVVVPAYEVSTPDARRVLPRSVGISQAVTNIQNTAMVLSSVITEDAALLKKCLFDTLHEPFREALVPDLSEVKMLLRNSPALGVVLSGAGSSILTLVEKSQKSEVLQLLHGWRAKNGNQAEVLDLQVDHDGLVVEIE